MNVESGFSNDLVLCHLITIMIFFIWMEWLSIYLFLSCFIFLGRSQFSSRLSYRTHTFFVSCSSTFVTGQILIVSANKDRIWIGIGLVSGILGKKFKICSFSHLLEFLDFESNTWMFLGSSHLENSGTEDVAKTCRSLFGRSWWNWLTTVTHVWWPHSVGLQPFERFLQEQQRFFNHLSNIRVLPIARVSQLFDLYPSQKWSPLGSKSKTALFRITMCSKDLSEYQDTEIVTSSKKSQIYGENLMPAWAKFSHIQ